MTSSWRHNLNIHWEALFFLNICDSKDFELFLLSLWPNGRKRQMQLRPMLLQQWLRGLSLPVQEVPGGLPDPQQHRVLRQRQLQMRSLRVFPPVPASSMQDLSGMFRSLRSYTVRVLLPHGLDTFLCKMKSQSLMNLILIGSWSFFFFFLRNCIECLGFDSGPNKDNCSTACSSITSDIVEQLGAGGKQCELKDSKGCWIKFSLEQLVGVDYYHAVIQSERGKVEKCDISPNGSLVNGHIQQFYSILSFVFGVCVELSALCSPACPDPPSVTAIVGASVASVALIGLLLLMIIKLLIYMKDLKEYRKFEKEKNKSKWTDVSLLLHPDFDAQQPTNPQSSSVARRITRCSKMQPQPSPTPPSLENNISEVNSTLVDICRVLMTLMMRSYQNRCFQVVCIFQEIELF